MIEKYFTNTVSRVEGISLKDLEADVKNLADCFKMYKWSSVTNKFELYKK